MNSITMHWSSHRNCLFTLPSVHTHAHNLFAARYLPHIQVSAPRHTHHVFTARSHYLSTHCSYTNHYHCSRLLLVLTTDTYSSYVLLMLTTCHYLLLTTTCYSRLLTTCHCACLLLCDRVAALLQRRREELEPACRNK